MTRWRRLARDYEARIDVSNGMIHAHYGEPTASTSLSLNWL
jgi:phage protein D